MLRYEEYPSGNIRSDLFGGERRDLSSRRNVFRDFLTGQGIRSSRYPIPYTLVIEIIPAILVKTEAEFRERLAKVEPFVSWVQLDVVDGVFAPNVTWGDPQAVASLVTSVRFEIDLMVADPAAAVDAWLRSSHNVGRLIFHQEAADEMAARMLLRRIRTAGLEAGLSLNPETPVEDLFALGDEMDAALLLGVPPGFGGQDLQPHVIKKIAELRARFPKLPIEVDGGVTRENARSLIAAGAMRLAAGSFIFKHPTGPAAALEELHI